MTSRHPEFRFLIDVNLPKYFRFFNSDSFIHVVDIDPCLSDHEIWNYALENDYVIVSKDTDFYNRFLISDKCPKVIFLKLGNLTLQELYNYFENNWSKITDYLNKASLIIAYRTYIKVVI